MTHHTFLSLLMACLLSVIAGHLGAQETSAPNTPEAMLLNIQKQLAAGQADLALTSANTLVEKFPHFRLGHLIRGDILQARTRPLKTLGDTTKATQQEDRLNDLRQEARGRFQAVTQRPARNKLPDMLIQLGQEQQHLLVVDTAQSRLYWFSNMQGTPHLQADYYITIGKAGVLKQNDGDQKTPLGIYRITGNIPGEKLTDFYGKGALTLNYPNTWDRQHGRTGYGIWLHGVPRESYSRPPKASNGCVVLSNPDMTALLQKIPTGTPVVITQKIKWLDLEAWTQARAAFVQDFKPNLPANLSIRAEEVSVFRYPSQENVVQITLPAALTTKHQARSRKSVVDQYWAFDGQFWHPVTAPSTTS